MQHIEHRLADIAGRHAHQRSIRDADRIARAAHRRDRSLRARIGQSIMRLGRRVGGDALTTPAWQG